MGIKIDPEKDLKIDASRLPEEFSKFPSLMYAYLEIKCDAEREYEWAKRRAAEVKAELYKKIKSETIKITEKALEAEIENETSYRKAKTKLGDAKHDLETIKAHVEALRSKKDMLIQLGADSRAERS